MPSPAMSWRIGQILENPVILRATFNLLRAGIGPADIRLFVVRAIRDRSVAIRELARLWNWRSRKAKCRENPTKVTISGSNACFCGVKPESVSKRGFRSRRCQSQKAPAVLKICQSSARREIEKEMKRRPWRRSRDHGSWRYLHSRCCDTLVSRGAATTLVSRSTTEHTTLSKALRQSPPLR